MSERTFHILVVAPFHAGEDHATGTRWTDPVRFDRQSFDEAMASVAPALVIDVPDPSSRGKTVRVDLTFDAMRAFRPDVLVDRVPLLRALREGASAVPPPPEPRAASLVEDILAGMGSPEPTGRPPTDVVLEAIVAHPAVRGIERAWRGLSFLATRSAPDGDRSAPRVVVEAIHAAADEVDAVLDRVSRLSRERGADRAFDLLVVDHALDASARDLARLEAWAARAESIGAPLVAGGTPALVGLDDLASLGRAQRRLRSDSDPRAAAARAVAARDATRWICLAMNDALARPRHTGHVRRTFGIQLDERDELFLGAPILVAALAAASFQRTGWACSIEGPTNGILRDLPVRTLDDRGTSVATPLEALTTEDAVAEAAAAGLTLFASAANADVAILPRAPVLYRGAPAGGGESPAASIGLVDQLFVARIARAVEAVAAEIPADTPEPAARDVARIALAELFEGTPHRPTIDVALPTDGAGRVLEVTVRPRGFYGVRLEEVTLGARLAHGGT